MKYNDSLIVGKVPKAVRDRTKKNMEIYNLDLYDAFNDAVCYAYFGHGTKLWKAWYYNDYRKYIPSVYLPEYLDFEKYPLKY